MSAYMSILWGLMEKHGFCKCVLCVMNSFQQQLWDFTLPLRCSPLPSLVPNRAHEGRALSQEACLRVGPRTGEWAAGLWSSKVLSYCLLEGGL